MLTSLGRVPAAAPGLCAASVESSSQMQTSLGGLLPAALGQRAFSMDASASLFGDRDIMTRDEFTTALLQGQALEEASSQPSPRVDVLGATLYPASRSCSPGPGDASRASFATAATAAPVPWSSTDFSLAAKTP